LNDRQRFALANPLNNARDLTQLAGVTYEDVLPGGNLLRMILAIDR
jgi:hypothetical protein